MDTVAEEIIPGIVKNEERELLPILKQVKKKKSKKNLGFRKSKEGN